MLPSSPIKICFHKYLLGFVKFFGNLAIMDSPQQICERYPAFVEKVFEMTESQDPTMIGVAVDTIGILGSNVEGKQVLQKTGWSDLLYVHWPGHYLHCRNHFYIWQSFYHDLRLISKKSWLSVNALSLAGPHTPSPLHLPWVVFLVQRWWAGVRKTWVHVPVLTLTYLLGFIYSTTLGLIFLFLKKGVTTTSQSCCEYLMKRQIFTFVMSRKKKNLLQDTMLQRYFYRTSMSI